MTEARRLHGALVEAIRLIVPKLPDGLLGEGTGSLLVSAPSFPIRFANSVWVDGVDEDAALRDLLASIAELDGRGGSAAVMVVAGRTPRVEADARRLGLTETEEMPGMLVEPGSFRAPGGEPPELRAVGSDPERSGPTPSCSGSPWS